MATCPGCKGHLTKKLGCPRSPALKMFENSLAALGGGLAALLVRSLVDPTGSWRLTAPCSSEERLAGIGLDRWMRR